MMSFPLPGFVISRALRAGAAARSYEVAREGDGQLFIARVREFDDPMLQLRVTQQLDRLRTLELAGVARVVAVERIGKAIVTISERAPGVGLHERSRGHPLAIGEILAIATQLCTVVAGLHAQVTMHGDLRPATILVDPQERRLSLADPGLARVLEVGVANHHEVDYVDALLPYLAPEQLSRSPIEPDARGDLYAIGVTLYELLTGRRPFAANTASELTRAQLVRRPRPPQELRPAMPAALAAIVMRLLEKQPDQRYQSARGLAHDLDRLVAGIGEGDPEPSFPLGERDFPTTLRMPRRLYGRAHLLAQLEQELAEVRERGESRVVFLRGEAGLGKSALLRAFVPPLGSGVILASGRFDADERGRPYRGFVEAIGAAIEQLGGTEARRVELRKHVRERLGPLLELALDLVPALANLFAGHLAAPAATTLGPREVERRVHVGLRRLLAALAERSPIVILLDDVQRLDPGSRELLRVLGGGVGGSILMVAAIQTRADDDERDPLDELRRAMLAGEGARELVLEPLGVGELGSLLSSTIGRPARELGGLAEQVGQRTAGNPLLIRHVLHDWVEQGVLALGERGWDWRPEALGEAPALDVGQLLGARMRRLDADAQRLLQRAACVGMVVELALLQRIAGLPDLRLAETLTRLEDEGMLVGEGAEHRFAHERLLELAESSLTTVERARIHWQIAGILREQAGEPGFALLDHLVAGLPAAGSLGDGERGRLVELASAGARRAANSAAWANAERYCSTALVLAAGLPSDPARTFALRSAHAEALALIGRHDEGDRAFAILLDHPLTPAEQGRFIARRVEILASQDRHADAIAVGLAALQRLGLRIRGTRASLLMAALRAWRGVRKLGRERLLALPEIRDERVAALLEIADAMQTPAFLTRRELSVELNALQVGLVVRHGFHPVAPRALSQFGVLMVVLGRVVEAAQLADWAIELVERSPPEIRPRVETAARLFVWPHARPLIGSLRGIEDLFERALAAGDRDTAGYVAGLGLRGLIELGAPLRELAARAKRLHEGLIGWATRDQRVLIGTSKRLITALIEGEGSDGFDAFMAREPAAGPVIHYGAMTTFAIADWLLGRRAVALARLEPLAKDFFSVTIGTWLFGRYAILRATATIDQVERGAIGRQGVGRWLRAYATRLTKLAAIAPANFTASRLIVEAERLRLVGDHDRAMAHYEHARSEAEQHGQLYAAGIAAERLADLAARLDQPLTRIGALKLARDVYQRWGASAVVTRLEREHPDVFGSREHESSTVTPAKGEEGWDIDGRSMLALMQAISEELHLEQVITRVLGAAIEHAGADRGVLVLERDGSLGIVAEGGVGSVSEYLEAPIALAEAGERLPRRVVEQVLRTGKAVIFDEFDHDPELARDSYFANHLVPSLLCLPIVKQHRRVGALLLEHESPMQEFTFERLEILRSFATQAASALDNARLYDALQRSEAQWRSLVGGVPDVITVLDERDRIEFTNHVGGFPIDPSAVVGVLVDQIIAPEHLEGFREALQAVRVGQGPHEIECRVAPIGFEPRWYLMRLAGIVVAGKVGKVIAISTDIEERKRDESDRARLEAQLRQQQRLESLGTLASGVAHEINNPIQGIMNYAELVRARPDDRAMVEEFAGEISHESQRVATIVRNLMAFSRQEREQQQLERVEVETLVENTLTLIRAVLRKDRIELNLDLDRGLPPLSCRGAQIQQILMNLVTNARDALNERKIAAEDRTLSLRARSWIREGRPWLRISVEDRGGGIDEAVLGRIFDPFFTTKGRDQGTGLGLAVSHGIALEHGGLLWVDNRPGQGATFHLDLPALERT